MVGNSNRLLKYREANLERNEKGRFVLKLWFSFNFRKLRGCKLEMAATHSQGVEPKFGRAGNVGQSETEGELHRSNSLVSASVQIVHA